MNPTPILKLFSMLPRWAVALRSPPLLTGRSGFRHRLRIERCDMAVNIFDFRKTAGGRGAWIESFLA